MFQHACGSQTVYNSARLWIIYTRCELNTKTSHCLVEESFLFFALITRGTPSPCLNSGQVDFTSALQSNSTILSRKSSARGIENCNHVYLVYVQHAQGTVRRIIREEPRFQVFSRRAHAASVLGMGRCQAPQRDVSSRSMLDGGGERSKSRRHIESLFFSFAKIALGGRQSVFLGHISLNCCSKSERTISSAWPILDEFHYRRNWPLVDGAVYNRTSDTISNARAVFYVANSTLESTRKQKVKQNVP